MNKKMMPKLTDIITNGKYGMCHGLSGRLVAKAIKAVEGLLNRDIHIIEMMSLFVSFLVTAKSYTRLNFAI
ncbi:MAG: hypothetical protein WCT27_03820 [Patescibacteria group bacterium]